MKLTAELQIADDVTYHSIIANRDSDIYNGFMRLKLTTAPSTSLSDKTAPDVLTAGVSTLPSFVEEDSDNTAESAAENSSDTATSSENSAGQDAANKIKEATTDIAQSVTPALSDGIVPYASSHLEGAASETIIKGGHSIQDTPEAVLTLRKILHQHLKQHPIETERN